MITTIPRAQRNLKQVGGDKKQGIPGEGTVYAKTQRTERTTVFLQEEVSAKLEVDSLAECR